MDTNGGIRTRGGGTIDLPRNRLDKLRKELCGGLLMPGDPGYDEARRVWNGMIDRRPALIARCGSEEEVARVLGLARDHQLLFSLRGGGHNVAGSAVLESGLVIDLSPMKRVEVDGKVRRVRVQAGATLGDLDRETQTYGLSVPVGLVSATGIAGLTLHGGLGWLARQYGLSADNLEAVELITAEGLQIRASSSRNSDLFWALQGGGGNFGAVTAFEFKAYPIGPKVWFAAPMYPLDRAPEVMSFFREFMSTAPDQLGAVAVYWSAPDVPQVPPEHRGEPIVILLACYTGPFEAGEEAIRPLRRIGKPLADLSGSMDFLEVQRFLDADYPDGGLHYWKSIYLEELSDEALAVLSFYSATRPSPESSIDVWALGGNLSRRGNNGGPLVSREAPYLLGIEANWHEVGDTETNIDWARA
ncbi:MAG: FAD-binding oxidoreductase, partial [Spirochaetales bacterium]|nr:FAD-binding oxidoreductase [Spirochaetales bacterium]